MSRGVLGLIGEALRSLVEGPVTKPYPPGPEVEEDVRGMPIVDWEKCVGCTLCARSCPASAIEMVPAGTRKVGKKEIPVRKPKIDYLHCIYCGLCAEVCPRGAITMEKRCILITGGKEWQP